MSADDAVSVHAWPLKALIGDYVRAGAGFAVTFPPLLFVEWTGSVVVVLGGLSVLFAWLALRTALRQRARVRVDGDEIARGNQRLRWSALERVTLRRFGARRRKDGGYMEMVLAGPATRIKVDSEISDFLALAARVRAAAEAGGVALDARTRANFQALGFDAKD